MPRAQADQRAMFPRFAAHAAPGALQEYEALLWEHGFVLRAHMLNDQECGGHTVWLASRD